MTGNQIFRNVMLIGGLGVGALLVLAWANTPAKPKEPAPPVPNPNADGPNYREFDAVESRVFQLERDITSLEDDLSDNAGNDLSVERRLTRLEAREREVRKALIDFAWPLGTGLTM